MSLPEWKIIGIESNRFEGQSDFIDHDLIVQSLLDEQRIEVDEVSIDPCLPRKFEYLGRHYDICGNQPDHFLSNWRYRLGHTLMFWKQYWYDLFEHLFPKVTQMSTE